MRRETQAEYLIGRFGGIAATAKALGHRNSSTVQGWKERGTVPLRQFQQMIEAGASLSPPLVEQEYFASVEGIPHLIERTAA